MTKGHNISVPGNSGSGMPADCREALQWFVNSCGLYIGSSRGLFLCDWGDENEASLEAAVINLKSRGFNPFVLQGDVLFRQADYLYAEAHRTTTFGRPLATKMELELSGADLVIIDGMEAPENPGQLWYLYGHLFYPRAIAGKPTLVTTPLSYEELMRYGSSCPDNDFLGKPLNWEKLVWLIEATMINQELFQLAREEGLPPLLKAEYNLYRALKERGLDPIPQHVLGDYLLDFALMERSHRLNIEVEVFSLGGHEIQTQEAKRSLVLLSDGWQILSFTTSEILANITGCAEATEDIWRTGRKKSAVGSILTGQTVAPMPDLPIADEVQLAAITHGAGPVAVTGGAGTGKTTCIVQRAVHLVAQGSAPESVLIIAHNSDTARALKRDLETALDKQAQRLNVYAWHDLGTKILKENMPAIRRKPPLKVESNPQKVVQRLLTKIKKELDPAKLELTPELDEFYVAAIISMYKAHLVPAARVREEASGDAESLIARLYQAYDEHLHKANRVDRDDLIMLSVQMMLENTEIRTRYNHQFEHVLVDDYQDVTVAQDMLARILSTPQDNLYCAGDEDETTTEGRNASPEMLSDVCIKRPHTRCYVLEKNWRSHPAILEHARNLLSGLGRRKIQKELVSAWGSAPAGAIIGPHRAEDEMQEADWVAYEIQILLDSGRAAEDIAVIFRVPAYSNLLEEALGKRGVPYQAATPDSGLVPDEVGDMLAYLKLVMDPDGPRARESFERVCQLRVREVDPKLSATIASFAEANNLSYLKAVEIYSEATADQSCRDLEQLVRIIRTVNQEKLPPAETISLLRRTQRLNDFYRSAKVPPGVKYEPLKKLAAMEEDSRNFKTVAEFVKHMSVEKSTASGSALDAGVNLKPIYDVKGTEYPVVFVVGLAEGVFPIDQALDLEEERRMAYVAFTRARELLYLSYPATYTTVPLVPSRFLIDSRLMPAQAIPVAPTGGQHAQQQSHAQVAALPAPAQSQPVMQSPQPLMPPPQPVMQSPQPLMPPPQPVMQSPQPVTQSPQPVTQSPQPAMPPPQPVTQSPQPVTQSPQPAMPPPQRVEPVVSEKSELTGASEPASMGGESRWIQTTKREVDAGEARGRGGEETITDTRTASVSANYGPGHTVQESQQPVQVSGFGHDSGIAAQESNATRSIRAPQTTGTSGLQPYVGGAEMQEPTLPALPKSKDSDRSQGGPYSIPAASAAPAKAYSVPTFSSPQPAAGGGDRKSGEVPGLPGSGGATQGPGYPPNPDRSGRAGESANGQPQSPEASRRDPRLNTPYPAQMGGYAAPVRPQGDGIPAQTGQGAGYSLPVYPQEGDYPTGTGAGGYVQPLQPQGGGHPADGQHGAYSMPGQNAGAVSVPGAQGPVCPACSNPLDPHARFCGECGYSLPARVPSCTSCGAAVDASAKFCGECGTPVNTAGQQADQTNSWTGGNQPQQKKTGGWMTNILKKLEE